MMFQSSPMHAREALIHVIAYWCLSRSLHGCWWALAASACGRGSLLPVPLHHPHTALKVGSEVGSCKHSPQASTQPHEMKQLNPDCFLRDKSFNNP